MKAMIGILCPIQIRKKSSIGLFRKPKHVQDEWAKSGVSRVERNYALFRIYVRKKSLFTSNPHDTDMKI